MQRVTVTLDDNLMADIDRIIVTKGYQNRSEAIRDLTRTGVREITISRGDSENCVAALIYVYEHAARELSKRLTDTFHEYHDLSLTTMHIHLDHEDCMEIAVMKGKTNEVQHVAEHVIAERGVRHGRLMVVPMEIQQSNHHHGTAPSRSHDHIKVR